jgi:hypothetical protein
LLLLLSPSSRVQGPRPALLPDPHVPSQLEAAVGRALGLDLGLGQGAGHLLDADELLDAEDHAGRVAADGLEDDLAAAAEAEGREDAAGALWEADGGAVEADAEEGHCCVGGGFGGFFLSTDDRLGRFEEERAGCGGDWGRGDLRGELVVSC